MSKNEKKIIFSEEIDSNISGFSLGVAFVLVALFIWFGKLFHNRVAEGIITIIMLFMGVCGTFLEIEKANQNGIKGFSDFGLGLFVSSASTLIILKFDKLILNVVFLCILLFGVYAMTQGILQIGYSLKIQKRKSANRHVEIFKIITGITEIIALIVVILQLIAELN